MRIRLNLPNGDFDSGIVQVYEKCVRKPRNLIPPIIFQHAAAHKAVLDEFVRYPGDIVQIPASVRFVESIADMDRPLYLQALKYSEDGSMIVARLSEQNGERGRIKLEQKVRLLNMLEETQQETDVIEYSPFEIITIGFEK